MNKFIKENWLLILSLIYVLSPIDFIPEVLLGPIGVIDDVFVVLLMIIYKATEAILNSRIKKKRDVIVVE